MCMCLITCLNNRFIRHFNCTYKHLFNFDSTFKHAVACIAMVDDNVNVCIQSVNASKSQHLTIFKLLRRNDAAVSLFQ